MEQLDPGGSGIVLRIEHFEGAREGIGFELHVAVEQGDVASLRACQGHVVAGGETAILAQFDEFEVGPGLSHGRCRAVGRAIIDDDHFTGKRRRRMFHRARDRRKAVEKQRTGLMAENNDAEVHHNSEPIRSWASSMTCSGEMSFMQR